MKKYNSNSSLSKSYCLFRLGKFEEAVNELKGDDSKIETQQLLGQIVSRRNKKIILIFFLKSIIKWKMKKV